jgi:hypothetical protein
MTTNMFLLSKSHCRPSFLLRIFIMCSTTGFESGARTAYKSGTFKLTYDFSSWCSCLFFFLFSVVLFCRSHFFFLLSFHLAIIGLLLTRKLLNQWFLLVKLKSSLRTFYGRHHDLVDR